MKKIDYSRQSTGKYDLNRNIWIDKRKFKNWKVGDIYNNYGDAESWSGDQVEESFRTEMDPGPNDFKVVLIANNITAHKVNYNDKQEIEILTAFKHEDEYLVSPETLLKIIDISSDDDYQEMKYYIVEVEML